jgi:hypothetical protein
MRTLNAFLITLILLAASGMTSAADKPTTVATSLDLKDKKVQREEISASQIGFTSTRVFYRLDDYRVVVVLHIDNTKKGFPVTGKVCQFAKDVTPEGIAKWLNNQHSDGLFPEVPEPKVTVELPAKACQSLESKLLGQKTVLDNTYNEYSVEIKLNEVKVNEQYLLQEFKDTVKVYVVAK